MWKNIGGKIKALAMGLCIFTAVLDLLLGVLLIAGSEGDGSMIAIGFLVIIFGPVIAWISSWLLYGFGELIDKASAIERNTRKEEKSVPQPRFPSPEIGRSTSYRNE